MLLLHSVSSATAPGAGRVGAYVATLVAVTLASCSLPACASSSSSGPPSTGSAQVTGSLGGKPFVPADAISYGNGGATFRILLTDYAGACAEAQRGATKPRAAVLSMLLPGAIAGTTYPVDATHAESGTVVSFDTSNADCTLGPPGGNVTAGHVTITAASNTSLSGTFELTFDVVSAVGTEVDTISGSFVAPVCLGANDFPPHVTCM